MRSTHACLLSHCALAFVAEQTILIQRHQSFTLGFVSISSPSFVRFLSLFVLLFVVFYLAFYKIMMNPTYAFPETSQANLQPETSESQHLLANLAIIVDPTLSINLQLQTLANLALIGVEASVADLTSNLGTMSSFWKQSMRVRAFTIRNLPPCSAEKSDHAEINSRSPVTLKRIKTSPRQRKGPGRRRDKRVLIGVPNSQLTTNFSVKYQLSTMFFSQFSVNY